MRRLRLVLMAVLLCASAVTSASAPVITKTYSYFDVRGLTGADLERELSRNGPMLDQTGIRHPGATRIKLGGSVDYKLVGKGDCPDCGATRPFPLTLLDALNGLVSGSPRLAMAGSMCHVTNARVTLETHLTLPRWKDRNRADRETVLVWDTLSSDIKRHEERHAEIARQYARKLEKTLEALHPERDCKLMEAKVEATSQKIIDEHAADQQRFDRVEAAAFERRMLRMLRFRAEKQNNRS